MPGEERSADAVLHGRGHRQSGKVRLSVAPLGLRLSMRHHSTVLEVKQRLQQQCSARLGWMRLFAHSTELHNSQRLLELAPSKKPSGGRPSSTIKLVLKIQNPHDFTEAYYVAAWGAEASSLGGDGQRLLASIQQGLELGFAPQLVWDGTGGTYVLRDARRQAIAAFKPRDEEPFAPNNPRGLPGKFGQPGLNPHVMSGDSHVREVLAHKLDWGAYAGVPFTLQAEAMHPSFYVASRRPLSRYGTKVGSLQAWVSYDDVAANRGAATFPVHEVHKIAILDMRLLNTDRNDANVLVRVARRSRAGAYSPERTRDGERLDGGRGDVSGEGSPISVTVGPVNGMDGEGEEGEEGAEGEEIDRDAGEGGGALWKRADDRLELIPIDHGGCLPSRPEVVWYNWCWLEWPQLKAPISAAAAHYIAALDPAKEAKLLADYGIPQASIRASTCSTLLLKRGVAAGLSLHDVALLMCRRDDDEPSEFEQLWEQVERLVHITSHNHRLRGFDRAAMPGVARTSSLPHDPSCRAERTSLNEEEAEESFERYESPSLSRVSRAQPVSPPAGGCAIKRIQSAATLLDMEHDHSAGRGAPPSSLAELETAFFMYFDRLLNELLKRVVARRRAEPSRVEFGGGVRSGSPETP